MGTCHSLNSHVDIRERVGKVHSVDEFLAAVHELKGRLVEVTRPDGVHHYQWDGWLLSQVIDASGVAQCVNTFDALGRIRTQRDATGHLTRFT